jgi:zinc transport system substrate-binding protein
MQLKPLSIRASALAWPAIIAAGVCLGFGATGCPARQAGSGTAPALSGAAARTGTGAAVHYLATVTPVKLMLDPLVAGRGDVTVLLKAGASSHTYEPTPSDAATAAGCSAFVWVGGDFDGFAAKIDAPQKIQLLPLVPEALRLVDHDTDAGGDSGANAAPDPHFLSDPLVVQAILPALVAELTRIDPPGAAEYQANADLFSKQLDALDTELRTLLTPIKGQATLLFHPSFAYLFQRYGIVLAGVIEQFPGKEPSPKYLQQLIGQIKAQHIRAIFTETLLPRQPAEVIAEGTGVPVLELDPACGDSGHIYTDYRDWLLYNARILRQALAP